MLSFEHARQDPKTSVGPCTGQGDTCRDQLPKGWWDVGDPPEPSWHPPAPWRTGARRPHRSHHRRPAWLAPGCLSNSVRSFWHWESGGHSSSCSRCADRSLPVWHSSRLHNQVVDMLLLGQGCMCSSYKARHAVKAGQPPVPCLLVRHGLRCPAIAARSPALLMA